MNYLIILRNISINWQTNNATIIFKTQCNYLKYILKYNINVSRFIKILVRFIFNKEASMHDSYIILLK